jgi:hypothetical protein
LVHGSGPPAHVGLSRPRARPLVRSVLEASGQVVHSGQTAVSARSPVRWLPRRARQPMPGDDRGQRDLGLPLLIHGLSKHRYLRGVRQVEGSRKTTPRPLEAECVAPTCRYLDASAQSWFRSPLSAHMVSRYSGRASQGCPAPDWVRSSRQRRLHITPSICRERLPRSWLQPRNEASAHAPEVTASASSLGSSADAPDFRCHHELRLGHSDKTVALIAKSSNGEKIFCFCFYASLTVKHNTGE